jgi:hemerythrin
MEGKKLEWGDDYSVGVKILDDQHKKMFATINELLEAINTNTPQEHVDNIIKNLIDYKIFHFETEEKYFKEFNYEGAEEHIAKHREFNEKLNALINKYPEANLEFAFVLIDFLEDWLLDHLMVMDQKYKECFKEHGLK